MRRFWWIGFLLLSACATRAPVPTGSPAPTPAPSIPAGKAAVHLYRRAIPLGPQVLSIYDAGHPVGGLESGTYLDYYANPGPRTLKATGPGAGSLPYSTTFTAGRSYYFVVYFLGDQAKGDASIAPVDPDTAAHQMATLKPANP